MGIGESGVGEGQVDGMTKEGGMQISNSWLNVHDSCQETSWEDGGKGGLDMRRSRQRRAHHAEVAAPHDKAL